MLQKYFLAALMVFVALEAKTITNAQENVLSQAKLVPPSLLPSIAVETSSYAYPSELFFGDTFYCQITRKNPTEKPVWVNECLHVSVLGRPNGIRFVIATEGIEENYTFVPEIYIYRRVGLALLTVPLPPGTSLVASYPLEMPPLEAMAHPFWRKLREKMTHDGVKCVLSVTIPGRHLCATLKDRIPIEDRESEEKLVEYRDEYYQAIDFTAVFEHEIIIKPRPKKEQELLDKWLRDTPKLFLPPLSEGPFKHTTEWWSSSQEMEEFERFGYRKSTGDFINIDSRLYNPWCFIRDGNRKPPAPVCPTTLEDWVKLENSLEPSTMRDEIQLTRMLIDYLDAKGNVQIQKRQALVEWLKSLPEPQSMSMASNLGDSETMFGMYPPAYLCPGQTEALYEPYYELLKAIQPMMSDYHKQYLERVKETHKMLEEGVSFGEILQHRVDEKMSQLE